MSKRTLLPQWREEAHKYLEELLDMYEEGAPLWLTSDMEWSPAHEQGAHLRIVISDPYAL